MKKLIVALFLINLTFLTFSAETRGMKLMVRDQGGNMNELQVYDRVFALVIGIDKYQDKSIPQLKNCVNDAKGIKQTLEKYYNFTKIEEIYNENATSNGIYAKFSDMQANNNITDKDAFFVFIASHGMTFGQMGYIIPYDGSFNEAEQYKNIGMSDLREKIGEGIVKAKHIFYCIDACYSGSILTRGGMATKLNQDDLAFLKEVTKERVRYAITAGDKGQEVLDGGKGGHSVFTGRLIEALEDANGYITGGQLSQQIAHKVFSDAQDRGHTQNPQYGRLSGMGDFVFIKKDGDRLDNAQKALDELDRQIALAQAQKQKSQNQQEQEKIQIELQKKEAQRKMQQLELEQMVEAEKKRLAEQKRQAEIQAEYEKSQKEQQEILARLQKENEEKQKLLASLQNDTSDMEGMVRQIANLNKSIEEIRTEFTVNKKNASEKVKANYAAKYVEVNNMKKDKWETPDEFAQRKSVEMNTYKMNETNELNSIENKYDDEMNSNISVLEKKIVDMQSKLVFYRTGVKVTFGEYNDVKQCYPGVITCKSEYADINEKFELSIAGDTATERREMGMKIENIINSNGYIGAIVFKYMNGKFSPIGYRILDISNEETLYENLLASYVAQEYAEQQRIAKKQ